MGKPRLIILVRHAQSEGNKNREIHQTIPDHRVRLTQLGWQQARDAGNRLRDMLRPDDTIQFYTSPYRRTRETTDGMLESLTGPTSDGTPSRWDREKIKVYEEPRLREQDFGNFQPCSAEMERMWQERADYGHFFYRIPDGESAADTYDRVSGFNESLWRQFGDDDFPSVCVLVTHGLMSRVFLMKWYHFTVEYFEDLRNVNHCEFLIMRKQSENGKYLLENKLRTWSELRRERAEKEKGRDKTNNNANAPRLERAKTFVPTRRWGGCPNGCNHGKSYKRREDLEALRLRDIHGGGGGENTTPIVPGNTITQTPVSVTTATTPSANILTASPVIGNLVLTPTIAARRQMLRNQSSIPDEDGRDKNADGIGVGDISLGAPAMIPTIAAPHESVGPQIDTGRATEDSVSSPDGTPSFISPENRILCLKSPQFFHTGRDFGGSYSGMPSLANSDADGSDNGYDGSDDEHGAAHTHAHSLAPPTNGSALAGGRPVRFKTHTKHVRIDSLASTLSESISAGAAGHSREGSVHSIHANRLGDIHQQSDLGSDGDNEADEDDELARAERDDRSIQGSVY